MRALQRLGQISLSLLERWGHGAIFFLELLQALPAAWRGLAGGCG